MSGMDKSFSQGGGFHGLKVRDLRGTSGQPFHPEDSLQLESVARGSYSSGFHYDFQKAFK